MSDWKPTACLICSLNCGIEVQTEGGHITRVRADKNHPVSQGYLCEKAQRMDAYQQGRDRLSSPMRRRADGSYEAINWDTAISEIAAKLAAVRDAHGGESIFYYGGGAQGNHLPGVYSQSTLAALGVRYRSNALAQEKTGEAWVQACMFGCGIHHDFEHAEVALLIGKNPWQSHGFPRARLVLREIAADPTRALIVIDPRKSETAAMADYHLAIRPGTDAWCLGALAAILVQDGLANRDWMAEHVANAEPVLEALSRIPVSQFAEVCGVDEALLRAAAKRMAKAETMASMEDLGMQMGVHSTLGSYLHRLIIGLTGAFGRKGTSYAFIPFRPLGAGGGGAASKTSGERNFRRSPVTGFPVVMGLIPCNAITEEILTDHPHRFRAMIVESANPVHSLADSARMREALRALDVSVVIDVAMTETARAADYVLPASSQFEKAEGSFFNFEPEANAFQLRHPLFPPREGTLEEGEIHARLCEALGAFGEADVAPLRAAAEKGLDALAMAFMQTIGANPALMPVASVLLYRALGPVLPEGLSNAAGVWGVAQLFVQAFPEEAARAGHSGPLAGNRLFEAILGSPSGTVFARQDAEDSWKRLRSPGQQINLHIPEMIEALLALDPAGPPRDAEYPFILSAGERRTETSNTSIRNPDWLRKGELESTLRIHPEDAAALGLADGAPVEVVSRRARARTVVECHEGSRRGHVSLPNGLGLDVAGPDGTVRRHGVALNELTDYRWRDPVVGTPWHKYVPVRLEPVG
ncbi:molybdopterin-dependent oxidoreductase [Erythrobacter sp. CCH5-A1]|jgi:anaerobic selenocysteine-containing dehydrogenase|uniref:molybdopterin-dependent oxidoreductase n=1 Tax=Erythrobacter sp. CCH5-A1 TaxID=1768792 RepID=UPI0008324E8A|nr:molybdopterin-dependent oxidoreductase [Erythrobacter sp. CCH5-A1]